MYANYLLVRMGRVQENNYFFLYLTKLTVVLLGHQLLVSRFTGSHLFTLIKASSVFVKTPTSPNSQIVESASVSLPINFQSVLPLFSEQWLSLDLIPSD